jgi:hypothetical protein
MDRRSLLKITAGAAVATAGSVLLSGTAEAETNGLPPVPGMLGDRRANEVWYQLDEIALYNPSQETRDAYTALFGYLGQESTLSKLQLGNFDRFYRGDEAGLTKAFADFGQGVLFDPRREPVSSEVHTMDGDPPSSYHFWHAIQRAQMLLGIDRHRWARIDPMLGFAWALQSVAKPDHRHVNPGLPAGQVRAFARYWLPREPAQLDHDFQSSPYPSGLG